MEVERDSAARYTQRTAAMRTTDRNGGRLLTNTIGLRREDRYEWERRTPLIPEHVHALRDEFGIDIIVQSSSKRVYRDDEYRSLGASVVEELKDRRVIVGLKEISLDAIAEDTVYTFFSHTVKGQAFNMPMLRRLMERRCTVIDYERIVDERNRRLIFFGKYAGLAGMIDSLWSLGRRLAHEGIATPLDALRQASEYANLDEAKGAVQRVGDRIRAGGLPDTLRPLIIGIAGYGNVSKGAQEILGLFPTQTVSATELLAGEPITEPIATVVFREQDTAIRRDASQPFDLTEYYEHPERYEAGFSRYLPHLHLLVNCIYWESKYPKLITRDDLRTLYADGQPRLRVIGDITCDVGGAIESTTVATESDNPVYVYEPETGVSTFGIAGHGPVVMAVEILPSELPRESSAFFSGILQTFVPALAQADFNAPLGGTGLPDEMERATIVYRGRLTPAYEYLAQYLSEDRQRTGG